MRCTFLFSFFLMHFVILFFIVLDVRHARQVPGIEPRTLRMLGELSTANLHPRSLDVFLIYSLHSLYSCPLCTNPSLSRAGFIF